MCVHIYSCVYILEYLVLIDILLSLFFLNKYITVLPFLFLKLERWKKFKREREGGESQQMNLHSFPNE